MVHEKPIIINWSPKPELHFLCPYPKRPGTEIEVLMHLDGNLVKINQKMKKSQKENHESFFKTTLE